MDLLKNFIMNKTEKINTSYCKPSIGPILGNKKKDSVSVYTLIDYNLVLIKYCYFVMWYKNKKELLWASIKLKNFEPNKLLKKYKIALFEIDLLDEDYTYCVFFSDKKLTPRNKDLKDIPKYNVKNKVRDQDCMTFTFGSCNYSLFFLNQGLYTGDETFSNMLKCKPEFSIFLGDQIYADFSFLFNPCIDIVNYKDLYKLQFNQTHIKKFLATTPIYNIIDDHEIYNDFTKVGKISTNLIYNWFHNFVIKPGKEHINNGILTYKTIQNIYNPKGLETINKNKNFYYTFEQKFCNYFVMDIRTSSSCKYYIDDKQLEDLKEWLYMCPHENIKFIGSSVPVYPVFEDFLSGSKKELTFLTSLLDFIFENRIRKVIFLCGDLHIAFVTKTTYCGKNKNIKRMCLTDNNFIYSVCSSPLNLLPLSRGLYADIFYEKFKRYMKTGLVKKIETNDRDYKISLIDNFLYFDSNFCNVDVLSKDKIRIKLISKNGKVVLRHTIDYLKI